MFTMVLGLLWFCFFHNEAHLCTKSSNLHLCWWWSLAALGPFPHWPRTNTWRWPRRVSLSPSDGRWPRSPATPSWSARTWPASVHRSGRENVYSDTSNAVFMYRTRFNTLTEIPPAWISQSWWTGSVPTGRARPLCVVKGPRHQNTQACVSPSPRRPDQEEIVIY